MADVKLKRFEVRSLTVRYMVLMGVLVSSMSTMAEQHARKTYRVTVKAEMPYIIHTEGDIYGPKSFEGFLIDLLHTIAEMINVEFVLSHVGDNTFGERLDDGTWTGMIGELQRNESDIAAGPLTVTAGRTQIVDFTQPFTSGGFRAVMKKPTKPKPASLSRWLFLKPFTWDVWMAIFGIFCIVVGLQFVSIRYVNPNRRLKESKSMSVLRTLNESAIFLLKGPSREFRSFYDNALYTVWMAFMCLCTLAYAARLTSIFVSGSTNSFPSLKDSDFVQRKDIQYGCLNDEATKNFFNSSEGALEKMIKTKMQTSRRQVYFESVFDALDALRNDDGPFVLIVESHLAYYLIGQEPCDLIVVSEDIGDRSHALACRPGLAICQTINTALISLKSSGNVRRMMNRWLSGPCGNGENIQSPYNHLHCQYKSDTRDISLDNMTFPVCIISVGIFVCILNILWNIYVIKANTMRRLQTENESAENLHQSFRMNSEHSESPMLS